MNILFLTAEGGTILGPLAKLFGYLMNGIYLGLEKIGIGNIGLAIIIFTLITRLILYPLTVKQQMSSKLMSVIQPEIKAIQSKYEGKKDQQSMMAQQAEIKAVYEKYGTSMSGSCVQLLIQMPIIFALYRVIMNVPAYVPAIKARFMNIVDAIGGTSAIETLTKFYNDNKTQLKTVVWNQLHNFGADNPEKYDVAAQKDFMVDFLYKLNPSQMEKLASEFSAEVQQVIATEYTHVEQANTFLGLNLSQAPGANGFTFSTYLLIPILAGLSQYLSVVVMQAQQKKKGNTTEQEDQMANTMKSMNIMMPIISAVFCWSFATGIGIYWIASAVFMLLTTLIINAQLKNVNIDDIIKKNVAKANAKRAKKGLPPIDPNQAANNIKLMEEKAAKKETERENIVKNQQIHTEEADKFYFDNEANPDSLFAKAGMVQKYNEKHSK